MAKAGSRSQRRVVPLGAALALVLFSYPSCAIGALFLTAEPGKKTEPILGVPALLLGCGLFLAGLAALPRAPRGLYLAAGVLATAASVAIAAGGFLFWQSEGRSSGGGVLCVSAALVLVAALFLLQASRKARRRSGPKK